MWSSYLWFSASVWYLLLMLDSICAAPVYIAVVVWKASKRLSSLEPDVLTFRSPESLTGLHQSGLDFPSNLALKYHPHGNCVAQLPSHLQALEPTWAWYLWRGVAILGRLQLFKYSHYYLVISCIWASLATRKVRNSHNLTMDLGSHHESPIFHVDLANLLVVFERCLKINNSSKEMSFTWYD